MICVMDIERERRALSVRCNMLARRFARSSEQVKITLFKAFCQSFYTSSLWVDYTQRSYSALRVQYNNAFRVLLRRPRFCSASAMFTEARTDGFHAIIRKRAASMLRRLRDSHNSILEVIADRIDYVHTIIIKLVGQRNWKSAERVKPKGVYTPNPPTRRHSPAAWCRRPKPAIPPTCVMGLCR
ncbi:unnamed protein product [Plutella xylostella]|uniref:(diamondback moth) hypothetical protein n=1 Tax=Plutella xylostella TaxID=51655 RepID=A0A8S4G7D9_PLUXY|nr:unnamed protein product [Plutella xylostella]